MRRGKPWTKDDVICARFLRHLGLTDEDIGRELKRSAASIAGKIGHQAQRKSCTVNACAMLFEAARPDHAKMLGKTADDFKTVGTA